MVTRKEKKMKLPIQTLIILIRVEKFLNLTILLSVRFLGATNSGYLLRASGYYLFAFFDPQTP